MSTNSLVVFEIELFDDDMLRDERLSSFMDCRPSAVDDLRWEHNWFLGEAGDEERRGALGQTDDVSLASPRFSGTSRVAPPFFTMPTTRG